ncbi:IclR family transcriptional regulator [Mesorhizobium sp. CA8]|uniref:IclR family transcriptional regulator n=1 Tax=unclassified Mesorhizobium TaxID=325217 RepID=UPI001CCE9DF2|nr:MULTISPECIES: IclR family transcriptional regulator [unclassified Mesorhizobium]MBZ9761777.1 IclR family transcriptional regulator [Mesorhizobium sp. CA8]MBZ9823311.1 IclR family transcriptional regulator [Mesorhizobium sp. CA4]
MDKTLLKGLRALEVIVTSGEDSGVTALAHELSLPKSNVHRILKTLEAAGYLRRDPAFGRYAPSLKLWELGRRVMDKFDIKAGAEAILGELAAKTRETVHLSVLQGREVLYIDKIDSPEPVRAYTTVGGRAPCYAVATGKALIAYLPAAEIEAICDDLKAFTPNTHASRTSLLAELEKVRAQGYAINQGEWRESVCGVAAPIRILGKVEAAIGVSGPASRMKSRTMKAYAQEVMGAARRISERLDGL